MESRKKVACEPHLLQVFMSLTLIFFLLTTFGYEILVLVHSYALNMQGLRNSKKAH